MTTPSGARRYRIILQGECRQLLAGALDVYRFKSLRTVPGLGIHEAPNTPERFTHR